MGATIDRLYEYPGHFKQRSVCRLRIFLRGPDKPPVVIVTELPDNPGTSVTNRIEHLIHALCLSNDLQPDTTIWLEHYPPRSRAHPHGLSPLDGERFSRVIIEFDESGNPCRPRWYHVEQQLVESWIGEPAALGKASR